MNPLKSDPGLWRGVINTIDAHLRIELVGDVRKAEDDIDIHNDKVHLYHLGTSFYYSDYSGSRANKVKSALDDALDKAVAHYG